MRRQPVNQRSGIVSRLFLAFDFLKISACTSLTGNGINHCTQLTALGCDEQTLLLNFTRNLFAELFAGTKNVFIFYLETFF
jgi:hypothetical protein